MHNLTIKATYKQKIYALQGDFPTEESVKAEIINRSIGDFSSPQKFSLQYLNEAQNFEQALKQIDETVNRTLKVTIIKNKKSKKSQQTNSLKQKSQLQKLSDKSMKEGQKMMQNEKDEYKRPFRTTLIQSILYRHELKKPKETKFQKQHQLGNNLNNVQGQVHKQNSENEDCGNKGLMRCKQTDENELPDFEVSRIYEKNLLDEENQPRSWREEMELKMDQIVRQLMFITKRQNTELREQLNMYKQKVSKNEYTIKEIQKNCAQLIDVTKMLEYEKNSLISRVKQLQFKVERYQGKFGRFEKDFILINEVNCQIQNRQILIEHKIEQLNDKIKLSSVPVYDQRAHKQHDRLDEEKSQKIIPSQLSKPEFKPYQQVNKQVRKQLQSQQQQQKKQHLKPIDCVLQLIQTSINLYVGMTYRPKIRIINTGINQWPKNVYLFEKDSKRTFQIYSLSPKEHIIFGDNTAYVAQRQGQNIQIKYQLYYLENDQKQYIGLPLSIFIKVKRRPQGKNEVQQIQKQEQKMQRQKSFDKETQIKNKPIQSSVDTATNLKTESLITKIDSIRTKLKITSQTTSQITKKLKGIDIDQNNFEQYTDQDFQAIIQQLLS